MTFRGMRNLTVHRARVLSLCFYEMFHRFSFFGFEVIMFLYLKHELDLQLHNAIGVYHVYVGLSCLVPFIGTLIADLYMNKLMSMMVMSTYALLGNFVIVVASAANGKSNSIGYLIITLFGLLLRAVGGGGIREISRSLGNDQFLSNEELQLQSFHQMLHYFMTFGTIMAVIVTPVLRMHVACVDESYCFPVAFCVPASFLLVALGSLGSGYKWLVKEVPGRSTFLNFVECIITALKNPCDGGRHWIDNASHAFTHRFLDDMKDTLRVLWLFLPLPIFWALFAQTGSRFVYQGSHMIGTISWNLNWYVEPDQMQVIIPIVTLILMPLFELMLYPTFVRCRFFLSSPRQRMFFGSLLAILAFVVAALVEMKIEPTQIPTIKTGEGNIAIWNTYDVCAIQVTTNIEGLEPFEVKTMSVTVLKGITVTGTKEFKYSITSVPFVGCPYYIHSDDSSSFFMEGKTTMHLVAITRTISKTGDPDVFVTDLRNADDLIQPEFGRCVLQLPRVGVAYYTKSPSDTPVELESSDLQYTPSNDLVITRDDRISGTISRFMVPNKYSLDFIHLQPAKYKFRSGSVVEIGREKPVFLNRGEVGFMLSVWNTTKQRYNYLRVSDALNVSIWWQLPQYTLISVATFLYPLTALEYAHSQVSPRMTTVLTSFWLLTISLGNFLVAAISFPNYFERELWYYVLFVLLMVFDACLLLPIVWNYKPTEEAIIEDAYEKKVILESLKL